MAMRAARAAFATICSLALTALPAASAHAKATSVDAAFGQAIELRLPRNADTNQPHAWVASIACPRCGDCVAGGAYDTDHRDGEAIVFEQSAEVWRRRATRLVMPRGAELNPGGIVNGVACARA